MAAVPTAHVAVPRKRECLQEIILGNLVHELKSKLEESEKQERDVAMTYCSRLKVKTRCEWDGLTEHGRTFDDPAIFDGGESVLEDIDVRMKREIDSPRRNLNKHFLTRQLRT